MKEQLIWSGYFIKSKLDIALNKFHIGGAVKCFYKQTTDLNYEDAQKQIYSWIESGEPKLVARYGSNEAYVTAEAVGVYLHMKKHIRPCMLTSIHRNAGVFPYGEETAMRFGLLMKELSSEIDMLGRWKSIMQDYCINNLCRDDCILTHLGNLEPYRAVKPWTAALRGKRVLVIHPFKETIEKQYQRREKLFENPDILPEFDLTVIKAVQTAAYEKDDRFSDWFEALDYMFQQAMACEFDVALIGCGAYGLPLGAMLKRSGKMAIHMGGALQLLFGIIGKRWENSPFINEYWVHPLPSETPTRVKEVENGCYW